MDLRLKMVVIKIMLFFAICGNYYCDKVDPQCQAKIEIKETIEKWWHEEMSLKKPLKCKIPKSIKVPEKAKKLLNIFRDRVPVKSYLCNQLKDETSIKFHFRGKISAGILTGSGKLTLTGPGLSDSNEACLKVSNVMVTRILNICSHMLDLDKTCIE